MYPGRTVVLWSSVSGKRLRRLRSGLLLFIYPFNPTLFSSAWAFFSRFVSTNCLNNNNAYIVVYRYIRGDEWVVLARVCTRCSNYLGCRRRRWQSLLFVFITAATPSPASKKKKIKTHPISHRPSRVPYPPPHRYPPRTTNIVLLYTTAATEIFLYIGTQWRRRRRTLFARRVIMIFPVCRWFFFLKTIIFLCVYRHEDDDDDEHH